MKIIKVDKSRLVMFMENKNLYKRIYIDGEEFVPTIQMRRGSRFHQLASDIWNMMKIQGNKLLLPKYESEDKELNIMLNNFRKLIQAKWQKHLKNGIKFFPQGIEKVYEKKISYEGFNIRVKGIIDLIDNDTIIEWKTGNIYPKHEFELNFYRWLIQICDGTDYSFGAVYYPSLHKITSFHLNKQDEVKKNIKEFLEYHEKMRWYS